MNREETRIASAKHQDQTVWECLDARVGDTVVHLSLSNDRAAQFRKRIREFDPNQVRAGEQVRSKEHDLIGRSRAVRRC